MEEKGKSSSKKLCFHVNFVCLYVCPSIIINKFVANLSASVSVCLGMCLCICGICGVSREGVVHPYHSLNQKQSSATYDMHQGNCVVN